jgi:hypothetical protein
MFLFTTKIKKKTKEIGDKIQMTNNKSKIIKNFFRKNPLSFTQIIIKQRVKKKKNYFLN